MKTRRLSILTLVFLIMAMLIAPMFFALAEEEQPERKTMPVISSLYDKERSEKEDLIYFRNNDVLSGTVLNETISISTPFGDATLPLRKCAGLSFEGAQANTESLITVNYNRLTGIISDRVINFKIGTSGATLEIRKEKVRFILLRKSANEASFVDLKKPMNLFVMTNGDLITALPTETRLTIKTDYGDVPVSFDEIKKIEMQGGDKVTAVITKLNGDTMQGMLITEEISLKLDVGIMIKTIYKDKFSKIYVGNGIDAILSLFGVAAPDLGESSGAMFSGEIMTNSIGMKFKKIPAGSFIMGSPEGEEGRSKNEGPIRLVTLTKPFYMGIYEVTQVEYESVIGRNPSEFKYRFKPVENVTWDEAVSFCRNISGRDTEWEYRLPTEAEWEYCYRAGTKTPYYWGQSFDDAYLWCGSNSGGTTQQVGTKKPNAWGLYDMAGNVWEWCNDWYLDYYPTVDQTDPLGPSSGQYRILRGGSWSVVAPYCRAACRSWNTPANRDLSVGFRVVASPRTRK